MATILWAITARKLRGKLPVGTIIECTMLGINAEIAQPTKVHTLRIVRKQSKYQMVTEFLEGDAKGKEIHLTWKSIKVERETDSIYYLSMTNTPGLSELFLKIKIRNLLKERNEQSQSDQKGHEKEIST